MNRGWDHDFTSFLFFWGCFLEMLFHPAKRLIVLYTTLEKYWITHCLSFSWEQQGEICSSFAFTCNGFDNWHHCFIEAAKKKQNLAWSSTNKILPPVRAYVALVTQTSQNCYDVYLINRKLHLVRIDCVTKINLSPRSVLFLNPTYVTSRSKPSISFYYFAVFNMWNKFTKGLVIKKVA